MDGISIDSAGDEDVVAVWFRWLWIPSFWPLLLYTYVSQPQPSLPISYDLMLYFFMQSWQMLSPDGILASQKVHAAVTGLLLVLYATANNTGYIENSY